MDRAYLSGRIAVTRTLIEAYEAAILALAGGVQSYTLDTSQSRQTVTKLDLKTLQDTLDTLYNRCTSFEARLNGAGGIGRPGW